MPGKVVKVNNQNVAIKDFNGQRVVTFKDIDTVHERADGTARKRFNDNKNHFVEGEDFFVLTQPSEIRTLGIERPQGGVPEKVTLVTESGYLMLVKSFTDDLAWNVQRQLVKSYCLYTGVKTLAFQAKPLGQPHISRFRKKKCRDTKLEVRKWKTIENQPIARMISNTILYG